MQITDTPIASDQTHWYLGSDCEMGKKGDPFYTLVGKNGKERNVTLADAKKHPEWALCPSVTEIIKCAAKPGLEAWKAQQTMLAALTLPRIQGEDEQAFCARIISDSKEQARKAAERGTRLHGAIERAIKGQGVAKEWQRHIVVLEGELRNVGIDLYAGTGERSFACSEGYGGKVDYSSHAAVMDFKSKPVIEEGKKLAYDEHSMQLGAYRNGLGYGPPTRLLSIFVGCEDAKVQFREWTEEEAQRGLAMFRQLLAYWKAKTGL